MVTAMVLESDNSDVKKMRWVKVQSKRSYLDEKKMQESKGK